MDRKIKFRAWHKTHQQWIENFMDTSMLAGLDAVLNHIGDIEVMQFTSQLDTSGREIYEGDILEAKDYWGEQDYGVVVWNDQQLQWYLTRNGALYEPMRTPFADGYFAFEVVGNIHENGALLK